jgi:hypothetical protein
MNIKEFINKIIAEDFIPRTVGNTGNLTRSVNTDISKIDTSKTYQQTDNWSKPSGLWYQINSSWIRYCNKENKERETYNYKKFRDIGKYNIMLNNIDMSNMIILDTKDKVFEFTNKYEIPNNYYVINWIDVAKDYTGIEIPNYQNVKWFKWMSSWDINSGCIWDLSIIKDYSVNNCEIISKNN